MRPLDLLVDCLLMPDLTLSLAKLHIRGGEVRVLWFIELVSKFKLFLQNAEVGSANRQLVNVFFRDLRLQARHDV